MKLPRVQFTVRRMMIAVAVVAVSLSAAMMIKRRSIFLERAAHHAEEVMVYQRGIALSESMLKWDEKSLKQFYVGLLGPNPSASDMEKFHADCATETNYWRRRVGIHSQLKLKYELAARYPWRSVAPDPPGWE